MAKNQQALTEHKKTKLMIFHTKNKDMSLINKLSLKINEGDYKLLTHTMHHATNLPIAMSNTPQGPSFTFLGFLRFLFRLGGL